jgi:hypothetical protein
VSGNQTAIIAAMAPDRATLVRALIAALFICAGLLPAFNMTWIVATTGANTLSNDYLSYTAMIGRMLSGTYNWGHYFRDTLEGGIHSIALPFLFRIAIAKWDAWNVYDELYLGIGAAGLKLLLLFDALTCGRRRFAMWPLWSSLGALVFALSEINVFGYGDAGMQIEFTQLGLAIAVWGIVRFPGSWTGLLLVVLGASIGSLSGDGGLIWPVSLLGLWLIGFRQWVFYSVWLAGMLVSTLPYTSELLGGGSGAFQAGSLFNVPFMVASIGYPFSPHLDIAQAQGIGVLGLALLLAGLVTLFSLKEEAMRRAAPALTLLVFSLANTWVISVFRSRGLQGMAPWYTAHFMMFWIGLCGLAYVIWTTDLPFRRIHTLGDVFQSHAPRAWPLALVVSLGWLYGTSNLTYTDKVMYLYSRAPVSAACVRAYRTAPPSCQSYVFQWGPRPGQLVALAQPLEQHRLSVFARNQEWTMQGDMALNRVHQSKFGGAGVRWSLDERGTPAEFADYRHLNLVLQPGQSVSWTLPLPAHLRAATLRSASVLGTGAGIAAKDRKVADRVTVTSRGGRRVLYYATLQSQDASWRPLTSSLERYAGETVTVHFFALGSPRSGAIVLWQYPRVDLTLGTRAA